MSEGNGRVNVSVDLLRAELALLKMELLESLSQRLENKVDRHPFLEVVIEMQSKIGRLEQAKSVAWAIGGFAILLGTASLTIISRLIGGH